MQLERYTREELIERFNKLVKSVEEPDCKAILNYFIKKFDNKLSTVLENTAPISSACISI